MMKRLKGLLLKRLLIETNRLGQKKELCGLDLVRRSGDISMTRDSTDDFE